jgi:ribosomal protein S13
VLLEVLSGSGFRDALSKENHTLKHALIDPRIISGIGNSYSDEALFAATLSPSKQTRMLSGDEFTRLYRAAVETLTYWIEKLRMDVGDSFPEKVSAFREGWRCTVVTVSPVVYAALRSSESSMQRMNVITARAAKLAVGFWQIVRARACSRQLAEDAGRARRAQTLMTVARRHL